MNFNDLAAFQLVYQLQSVSAAAAKLHLTQSALSKRLVSLQNEVNIELIDTHNKRLLAITDAGEAFYRYASTILTQYQLLQSDLDDYRALNKGTLRLGAVPIMAQYGITEILSDFMAAYPGIDIRLNESEGSDVLAQLAREELDAVIIRDTQTGILKQLAYQFTPLATDQLKVIVDRQHPLAKQNTVSFADLIDYDLVSLPAGSGVYEPVMAAFQQLGKTPNIRFESTHIETIMGILNDSQRAACLFSKSAQPFMNDNLVMLNLAEPISSQLLLVQPDKKYNLGLDQFSHFLTQTLADN